MTISTHAATDEYRDGWDRVFGKGESNMQNSDCAPPCCTVCGKPWPNQCKCAGTQNCYLRDDGAVVSCPPAQDTDVTQQNLKLLARYVLRQLSDGERAAARILAASILDNE